MGRLFVIAEGPERVALRAWLLAEGIASGTRQCPSAYIQASAHASASSVDGDGIPTVLLSDIAPSLHEDDIVVVAGAGSEQAVGALLHLGIRNVFDGDQLLRSDAADHRFLRAARHSYIGPTEPVGHGLPVNEAGRFDIQPLTPRQVPPHKLFIVNSMPKSGTLWMAAMLEALLGVRAREQIVISHAGDLEQDWNKPNNHAAVTLVRDLRAVVVSWYDHACRTDREMGFKTPRFPTLSSFYWQYFLGTVRTARRFYQGDLEHWLDLAAASYIPIVRFEDMVQDAASCLGRVADAWRIDVPDTTVQQIARDFGFDHLAGSLQSADGYIGAMVSRGHLRRGKTDAWKEELPPEIAADIQDRFRGYQRRLGYHDRD